MHLYKVVQDVLACQEAMWEELKSRILNRKGTLKAFGWDDDEELEELQSRRKFEILIERYQSDMRVRISLWSSLTDMGWTFPIREQLSKAEHLEEERVRRDLLEAIRRHGRDSVSDRPCRNMKAFFGYKPA
ncbi:hypothetical protein PUNSTDRAFT_58022 [Punctularia strigosozonata HHB-11173 SS5]|uniref:uncharacterized protein n=1 Tax=Punctularia strigosozonata (strain HHB-11173) TaxID=741275 RepID=UPI00044171C8|nr:uncharacterized protein PUNSTDRAFT_58022 [Punctularia strigosozonata HHB-11173 SS5]EIN13950.1 hypothetical protein PUNSTDRAFT_58022 [Punctularia strigosozonata HHB-11173 SS5]